MVVCCSNGYNWMIHQNPSFHLENCVSLPVILSWI
uniref:Uncharacterized protein n=1 Tax=Rhizophora mucronata TaxID=61149 RepID=A0A2P2NLH4_RHIMU